MKLMFAVGALLVVTVALCASGAKQAQGPEGAKAKASTREQAKSAVATSASKRKIACKTQENAALCYWTHGRLAAYEGMVTYRIWKIGTRRLLGVFSGPSHYPASTDEDMEFPEFPPELDKALEADNRRHKAAKGIMWTVPPPVFADFEVCPLRPEEEGVRQPVCIESAKNIFVHDEDY